MFLFVAISIYGCELRALQVCLYLCLRSKLIPSQETVKDLSTPHILTWAFGFWLLAYFRSRSLAQLLAGFVLGTREEGEGLFIPDLLLCALRVCVSLCVPMHTFPEKICTERHDYGITVCAIVALNDSLGFV